MPPPASPSASAAFTLRPAVDADRAFCRAALGETIGDSYLPLFDEEWSHDIAPSTRIIEAAGQTVGLLTVYVDPQRVFVRFLVLVAAWQSRGIGEAVLRSVIDQAGPRRVELKVNPAHARAQRFYERVNFRLIEATADYHLMRFARPIPTP